MEENIENVTNYILQDFKRLYGRLPKEDMGFCFLDFGVYQLNSAYFEKSGQIKQQTMDFYFTNKEKEKIGELGEIVFNHNYPNKDYHTASVKVGKKVSRYGCYLELPIEDFADISYLVIEIEKEYEIYPFEYSPKKYYIPVKFQLSKEKPIGTLGLTYSVRTKKIAVCYLKQEELGSATPVNYRFIRDTKANVVFLDKKIDVCGSKRGYTGYYLPWEVMPMGES